MAEAGAHLNAASVSGHPSVFEVLAQESLMETIRPALRHAVKVLAQSDPSHFGFLWQTYDELYLLLDLLLQNHFLFHYNGSFSENFYSLKRVPVSGGQRLPRMSNWCSLLLLCLVPYLRAKLEKILAQQREEEDFSIRLGQTRAQRIYQAAVAAYPYVSAAWQAWVFCQCVLYVFGGTKTHNPLLWLARVRLARLTIQDIKDMELKTQTSGYQADWSLAQRAWWMMSRVARGVAASLSTSLSVGVFFLQFLDWWYTSDNQSTVKALTSLPVPPPPVHLHHKLIGGQKRDGSPSILPSHREEAQLTPASADTQSVSTSSCSSRTCPLCRRVFTNATALSTSGFVFCYRCIYPYVKANHRCPVTGYPTELQHVVRIYMPDS
ncbi:peroxisome assembly protein 12 [Thalassophryne amazonica]|uniref:peroxisome assembly protein 12 n=1 Tax=Thalassophryne amazonica TaxID=390379 RepID=UPI00147087B8|nr:peroxisome assembly protein 12 [Thalassophryne amazonica]XP_034046999.1 peroxisome assembly protein 12 [Thalassophryne amazonica]XP_034047000.1 peroxisome assembly protein 12 [Thalassophryne amazonica]XP_034047001.1 peroxisome assembly protein 12 [Thalassophryne amazonica]